MVRYILLVLAKYSIFYDYSILISVTRKIDMHLLHKDL